MKENYNPENLRKVNLYLNGAYFPEELFAAYQTLDEEDKNLLNLHFGIVMDPSKKEYPKPKTFKETDELLGKDKDSSRYLTYRAMRELENKVLHWRDLEEG